MLLKKFCFLICINFLFQSLYDVYNDSKSVQYVDNGEKINFFNFSFCIKLDEELLKNFKKTSNNLYQFTVKELVESTCHKFFSNLTCLSSINLKMSYLLNYHSCLMFVEKDFDVLIRNLTDIDFHIFAFPNHSREVFFFENVFTNVAKLEPFTLKIRYIEYHQLESPYETDCYHYSNEKLNFKTEELVNSRASCLYECFKTGSRSLSYYYSRRDVKPLIVHQRNLNKFKEIGNWRNSDENLTATLENKCLKICRKGSCILSVYLVNEFRGTGQTKFKLFYKSIIYSAKPLITKTQTILNSISLIVLFLNISFYETIPYLIKKTLSTYLTNLNLFNRYYWIFKLIILIFGSSIAICLSLFRIFEYSNNYFNRLVASNFPTEISPFYLMICVPIQVLINNHSILNEEKEKKLINEYSFSKLENLTDFSVFKSGLERIYIQYATIEKEISYSIDKTKIVFRYFDYEFEHYTMTNFLLRCYKIDLNLKELRYETLYSLSKLKIILKFNWYIIHPIPKDFNLTTSFSNLISDPYMYKRMYKEKFYCSDYLKNRSFTNLSDHDNGFNQCLNEEHLKNYKNLTIKSVIYKETIASIYKLNEIYFNQTIDINISKKCRKKFTIFNCYSQYFKIDKLKPINQINKTFTMNLYYIEHIMIDNIILTLSDLLLNDLLSFESIFIGLNIGKILFILLILLKKYKLNRILKYYNYFQFIILVIGLLIHFYYIIDDILNSEHIFILSYSISKSVRLPNLIFCFEIQNYNEIDLNYKQNSNYLDNFTKNLNLNFFKNVSFLDNNYYETFFLPNENETIKNLDKINSIYFLNLKCFEFVFKPINNAMYIHILNDQNFINFKFNKRIILNYFNSSNFNFYLMIRKNRTNELNGIEKINFNFDKNPLIKVYQKLNIIKVEEKFSFIHNPLSILYDQVNLDDTTEYINQLSDDFRKFDLRTKRIIMNSVGFDNGMENLEFDDEIFDQYFYQIKNFTDFNRFRIVNYERKIYIVRLLKSNSKKSGEYDLKFYLDPLLDTYKITNRDNYSKFIISILNCLNIWLNFCCLDFYIYLNKLCNLIYELYSIVLSFKFYLKRKKLQILMRNM